jgi:uncharacterized protein (DUF2384 family)
MAAVPILDRDHFSQRAEQLEETNRRLAGQEHIPDDVWHLVDAIADEVMAISPDELSQMDPYLFVALQHGALAAYRAMHAPDPASERRQLRIGLERMRQALRDFAEEAPVRDARPAKEVARWLADTVHVPQATLAELVGTAPRTFQRWISAQDASSPQGDEERRLRTVARIAGHLRHALSGPGVVAWFQRPRPELDGRAPAELLADPLAAPQLLSLAAAARSSNAA